MSTWQQATITLKSVAVGATLGVSLYAIADLVGDLSTFFILRKKAVDLANNNEELKHWLGFPFSTGPWYNARMGFSQHGHICQTTFPILGTNEMTDLTVRAVKRRSYGGNAFYNFLGSGEWTLLACDAMFPAGGALAEPKSLLPPPLLPESAHSCGSCEQAKEAKPTNSN